MKPNAPPPQLVIKPVFLTQRPYPEEALGHLEQQLGDRLGLPVGDWATLHVGRRSRLHRFSPGSFSC
jgi:hypothetical protein